MAAAGRPDAVLAYITCASAGEAECIGRALVAERLAACINILPGMRVLELHSYSCPCVVVLPLLGGNRAYLDWLAGEVRPAAPLAGPSSFNAAEALRDPPTGAPPPG